MTNDYQWAQPENYAYLKGKTPKNWAKGWAWEFIRRNAAYQEAYYSFGGLQKKHGDSWRKKQECTVYEPARLQGESEGQWYARATSMLMVARKLSPSQVQARGWGLYDLYDPALPYNEKVIRYDSKNYYPLFYADDLAIDIPQLNSIADLENDISNAHNAKVLLVALDITRPLKSQLAKVGRVFDTCAEYKAGEFKGHAGKWIKYVQVLDALHMEPTMPTTKILRTIGVKVSESQGGKMAGTASGYKESALKMVNSGYKGLLRQIQNA